MPKKLFQKGKSGNPSGRPKVVGELRDLARTHTEEAIETLVKVMRDSDAPPVARATAANAILDRGHGKPTQHVEANVNFLDKLSDDEQRGLLAALQALDGDAGESEDGTDATHH